MNGLTSYVVLVAAGVLILQLIVVTTAREAVWSLASAPGTWAPPTSPIAAENWSTHVRSGTDSPIRVAATQPVKAGGEGDPASVGKRYPLHRLLQSSAGGTRTHSIDRRTMRQCLNPLEFQAERSGSAQPPSTKFRHS
ncbi:MAG: hypothetical protein ABSD75_06395 [Terriglobales bacterium]|jgi:hypothetical protein